jgi:hypothetical protein
MTRHPPAIERMVANATALVPGRLRGVSLGSGVKLAQAAAMCAPAHTSRAGAWPPMLAQGGECERLPTIEQRLVLIADAGTPRPVGERGVA